MRPSVGPEERSTSTALDSRRGRRDTAEAPPWWCTQANATWAASAVALLAFAVCAVRLLQPHALWHLLTALAMVAWAVDRIVNPGEVRTRGRGPVQG